MSLLLLILLNGAGDYSGALAQCRQGESQCRSSCDTRAATESAGMLIGALTKRSYVSRFNLNGCYAQCQQRGDNCRDTVENQQAEVDEDTQHLREWNAAHPGQPFVRYVYCSTEWHMPNGRLSNGQARLGQQYANYTVVALTYRPDPRELARRFQAYLVSLRTQPYEIALLRDSDMQTGCSVSYDQATAEATAAEQEQRYRQQGVTPGRRNWTP